MGPLWGLWLTSPLSLSLWPLTFPFALYIKIEKLYSCLESSLSLSLCAVNIAFIPMYDFRL